MSDLNELRERFNPISEEALQKAEDIQADTVGEIKEKVEEAKEQAVEVKESVEARLARLEGKFHIFEPVLKFLHDRQSIVHRLFS